MNTDPTWVLSDPHALHAMLVHWPIVLGILGVPMTIAVLATGARSTALKLVALACMVGASAGAGLAAGAGEDAEASINEAALGAAARATLERHESLGDGGWVWPLIPAGLLAVSLAPTSKRWVPMSAAGLALASSLGVAVWVGLTAHAGGELVYRHGVGVPGPAASGTAIPSGAGERDD